MSNPSDFVIEVKEDDGLVILREYKGKNAEVIIPDDVNTIGSGAFSGIKRSLRVTIPSSVKKIGALAFSDCSGLISVVIPGTVKKIPWNTFSGCSKLEEVTLCEGVEELDSAAFKNCKSLKRLTIPGSVKTVGKTNASILFDSPFIGCKNLAEVILSEGVKNLEDKAFDDCSGLKRLTLPNTIMSISSKALPQNNKKIKLNIWTMKPSVLPMAWRPAAAICFAEDGGEKSDPRYKSHCKYIKSNNTRLVSAAMNNQSLLSLMCREKLITAENAELFLTEARLIGDAKKIAMLKEYITDTMEKSAPCADIQMLQAEDFVIRNGILLRYTGIGGEVAIPEGVTEIGEKVFKENANLKSVTFPDSLRIIGREAFANCNGLTAVTIPSGVKEIRLCAFDWCDNLKDVYISDLKSWCNITYGGLFCNCGNPLSACARLHVNGELLTELVIPEGVETVQAYAFFRCIGLKSVVIPRGVTSIGHHAFFECTDLECVSIAEGVTSIGENAFMHCEKITELVIPEGVENLDDRAFGNCGSLRISLPGSLTFPKPNRYGFAAEGTPFVDCRCTVQVEKWKSSITKLLRGCSIEEIITTNYALVPGDILLPVAVKMTKKKGWDPASDIGKDLLNGLAKCAEKQRSVVLKNPEWLQLLCDNKLIKARDLDGFLADAGEENNTEAKAILLNYQNTLSGDEIEKAREKRKKEKEAYEEALVKRAAKRDPSKGIEGMTFVISGQLRAWPKVWSSRDEVQQYLSKYGAALGLSINKQTDYLVTNDTESGSEKNEKAKQYGVDVITEEEFNKMIGRRFADEETVSVPAWVKTIEAAAFSNPDWESWKSNYGYKKLREVKLPEDLTAIGEKAFAGAENLEKINIPESVTSIGSWSFAGCTTLAEIKLPKKLQSIQPCTFAGCSALTKIVVPNGITDIGIGVFRGCVNLEEIYLPDSISQIEFSAFDQCNKLTIYAPAGSFAAKYAKRNSISLSVIGNEDEHEENGPDDFVIKNGVLEKYNGPGGNVVIPDGVTEISPLTFANCSGLTSVTISASVIEIGGAAFMGCSQLEHVIFEEGLKRIGDGAFMCCSSLTEICIPRSVAIIEKKAFYSCKNMKSITIYGSISSVEEETFAFCDSLTEIRLSEGVESIGKRAFNCCNLKDYYFPASLQKIDRNNNFFRCTIHAPAKSYAVKYAKSHKIAYVIEE